MLVAYLEAAGDRLSARRQTDFEQMVEAVRAGTIFAHDRRAAEKWRNATTRVGKAKGLVGAELEAAIMSIKAVFPDNVIVGA